MRIALLGMDDLGDQISDDHLLKSALEKRGFEVSEPSWKADQDWSAFDLVLIRATWDYHLFRDEFLEKLAVIESSGTLLLNSLDIVSWNSDKRYLAELEKKGVKIVPTIFRDSLDSLTLEKAFLEFGKKLIVKPVISANSLNTIITTREDKEALEVFKEAPCMIQPFMENIKSMGEYSLYFYDGEFSHAIVKKPEEGDFRVQEDFGGTQQEIIPNEELLVTGKSIIKHLPEGTFYARVDLIPDSKRQYLLIELELIEPGMYFRFCKGSAENFANHIEGRLN